MEALEAGGADSRRGFPDSLDRDGRGDSRGFVRAHLLEGDDRRAVFLTRGFGINAFGYEADDVQGRHSVKTCLREQLAKIAALIDVVICRQPKFLGPFEKVPE